MSGLAYLALCPPLGVLLTEEEAEAQEARLPRVPVLQTLPGQESGFTSTVYH